MWISKFSRPFYWVSNSWIYPVMTLCVVWMLGSLIIIVLIGYRYYITLLAVCCSHRWSLQSRMTVMFGLMLTLFCLIGEKQITCLVTVYAFVYVFTRSFMYSLMYSLIHWFVDSLIHPFIRSFVRLFVLSFAHIFIEGKSFFSIHDKRNNHK